MKICTLIHVYDRDTPEAVEPTRHRHGHVGRGATHEHRSSVWSRLRHHLTPHSHDANDVIASAQEASTHGVRAAWIGLVGMALTAALQILIVAISGSVGLLADTVHNIGHAVTTVPLLIAFQLGRRAASHRYPFGYRRAEDLAGLLIGLVIAVSAAYVLWEAADALRDPPELANLGWVFAAGLVGFVGNESVAVYRIRAGRRIGSAALVAEGQHARADALTSIAVVLGVVGIWLGFSRADAVVGLVVGLMMIGILVTSMRPVARRLMDGVDDGLVQTLASIATQDPAVLSVSRVRARWTGHRIQADMTVAVDGTLPVVCAQRLTSRIEGLLVARVPSLDAVVISLEAASEPLEGPVERDRIAREAERRPTADVGMESS